jgi:hypothetical protein
MLTAMTKADDGAIKTKEQTTVSNTPATMVNVRYMVDDVAASDSLSSKTPPRRSLRSLAAICVCCSAARRVPADERCQMAPNLYPAVGTGLSYKLRTLKQRLHDFVPLE